MDQGLALAESFSSKAPVFVVGFPRSGTTLLYHTLLSAGNFAVYRAESIVFNVLVPGFGNLGDPASRQKLLRRWLSSRLFTCSGLDASEISARIMEGCRNGGDFLRMVMESIATQQGVERWADCTPEHVLHIPEIKRQIPNALILHIIRDGRDAALSYAKQGWSRPLPWDRRQHLAAAALYWDWMVRRGRAQGRQLGSAYQEVFFEDLVKKPRETLARLSPFVGQELDLDRIRIAGIGSVSKPNTSFPAESANAPFDPVGRWKNMLKPGEVKLLDGLVGPLLHELGYPVSDGWNTPSLRVKRMRATYAAIFGSKFWLRGNTPAGRFIDLSRMESAP